MKFEFDSNNATELRAVEAAVAVLLDRLTPERQILTEEADPLVAAVTEAQQKRGPEAWQAIKDAVATREEDLLMNGTATAQPVGLAASELDSAGQPWNPEIHSSSRAKVADGTWKKKRGVSKTPETVAEATEQIAAAFAESPIAAPTPPVPPAPAVPTPPAPQADGLVTMNDIWALVTNGKTTINVVLEAAQRMGFADLGKVAQTATAEQRAALLKELTV